MLSTCFSGTQIDAACEQTVAHLADCCPGFPVRTIVCEVNVPNSPSACGHDPCPTEFSPAVNRELQETSCADLGRQGRCDLYWLMELSRRQACLKMPAPDGGSRE